MQQAISSPRPTLPFLYPLPVSPLAVSLPSSSAFLQTGCTDVIATPLLPRFFSSTDERKAIPPRKRGGMVARLRPSCFEFCERTASSLDAVLFNLEERKDIGTKSGRPRLERKRKENRSIKFTRISYFKEIEGK